MEIFSCSRRSASRCACRRACSASTRWRVASSEAVNARPTPAAGREAPLVGRETGVGPLGAREAGVLPAAGRGGGAAGAGVDGVPVTRAAGAGAAAGRAAGAGPAGARAAGAAPALTVGRTGATGATGVRTGAVGTRVLRTSTWTSLERPWLKLCRTDPASTVRPTSVRLAGRRESRPLAAS
jgi:hypothetical protein